MQFLFRQIDRGAIRSRKSVWFRRAWFSLLVIVPLGMLPEKSWEVVAGQQLSAEAIPWDIQFDVTDARPDIASRDAESLLREAHRRLATGQPAQALSLAQELVTLYPHFQLGQLFFSDLLSLTADRPLKADAAAFLGAAEPGHRLHQLNEEAHRRLKRPDAAVYEGKQPEGLVFLSSKVPFLIVVDASRSRLYVMSHDATRLTAKASQTLKVVFESYMSVGQRGVGKQYKGDQKTPLGAYVIKKSYPGHSLPDMYGSGALTLNYPNDLDNQEGKTGSGIWLHGSPSDQYARAPESSDGCVVLANPDMSFLMKLGLPAGTPVLIQRQIKWVDPQRNSGQAEKLWEFLQERAGQREILAAFSWQEGAGKMMSITAPKDMASMVQLSEVKPTYWFKQSAGWSAVSSPPDRAETYARYAGQRSQDNR